MIPNYKLGFIRSAARAPAAAPAPAPAPAQAPAPFASRGPVVTKSNRFSINRLVHVKNSGGCRSCGS